MPTLNFKGKSVIETYHHTVPHHTLEFDRELSRLEKDRDPSLDGNLIIEGDNLLALKALLPTHAGKVKCIYIDPPYNTGNEGWVYNDNLTQPQFKEWIGKTVGKEGEDFCRHDKWCCMMYPRLSLLRELLTEDGSIWISIDDHEVHNLRHLMDEIFAAHNFVATVIWQKMDSPKNTAIHLSEDHDYILVYARDASIWRPNLLPRSEEMLARYQNPDNDPRGPWLLSDLAARNKYDAGRYPITTPSGKTILGPPAGSYWRVSKHRFDELEADNRIWWGKSGENRPGIKRFLSEVQEGVVPQTFWQWKEVGSTRNAKQELSQITGAAPSEDLFITPKPTKLIERIAQIATDSDSIMLDSFAGTGTTGHAVLKMNARDDGNRRFVLVQLPHDNIEHEKGGQNICREITVSRLQNAVTGYSLNKGNEKQIDALGGNFTYAKLSDDPLFNEYRDFGEALPAYEDLARYIFYTETSREFPGSDRRKNKAWDKKAGRIGRDGERSYYLLYQPNGRHDMALDRQFLDKIAAEDENPELVVYCERIAVHKDELRQFQRETNKRVRTMIVPFELK